MTNRIAILGMLAFAAGCAGDEGIKGSGETGTTDTDTMTGMTECPEIYTGPTLVQLTQVSCLDNSTVRFYVETDGWTGDGLWFSQETGNAEPQWADEHDILSFEFDDCGFWDHLEQELTTGAGVSDWSVNQSTVFSCEPNVHFDGSGVMSYAARVYDIDGNFADCLAWGHDPQGMIDGDYSRANEPTAASELDSCEIGVPTR